MVSLVCLLGLRTSMIWWNCLLIAICYVAELLCSHYPEWSTSIPLQDILWRCNARIGKRLLLGWWIPLKVGWHACSIWNHRGVLEHGDYGCQVDTQGWALHLFQARWWVTHGFFNWSLLFLNFHTVPLLLQWQRIYNRSTNLGSRWIVLLCYKGRRMNPQE